MRTILPILLALLVFIPSNNAKNKSKKKDTTPTKEPLQFVGCFKDSNPRDLPQRVFEHGDSIRSCVNTCKNMKYRFAGIQFAYLCFCGNLKGRFGQLPDGRCDKPCRVTNETQCGGEWANSVYRTGYEPTQEKRKKMLKKQKKVSKRDNVVMFDNPTQYQNADDRTFTIDVDTEKRSAVPDNIQRIQRSYGSDYYETVPKYGQGYNQYYGTNNQYNKRQYNSYPNSQYTASTKSDVPSNYTSSAYNNEDNQGGSAYQQYPQQETNTPYSSQSNATSSPYGETVSPQPTSYQALSSYNDNVYDTKATSNNNPTSSTESNYVQKPSTHDPANGYLISVTLHDDNATTAGSNPTTTQSTQVTQGNTASAYYNNQAPQATNPGYSQTHQSDASPSPVAQPGLAPTQTNAYATQAAATATQGASAPAATASTQSSTQSSGYSASPQTPQEVTSQATSQPSSSYQQTGAAQAATSTQPEQSTIQEVIAQANAPASSSYDQSNTASATPAQAPATVVQASSPAAATAGYDQSNTASAAAPPSSSGENAPSTDDQPKSPCTIERKMAQQMSDTFTPACDKQGNYEPVQCFEHKGYGKQCWCVDQNGHEKKGTRVYGDETPSCVFQAKPETQCERERKIASSAGVPDVYTPACDNQGNFMATQCFDHSTYGKQCWCVDKSGQEIKGTRTHGDSEPPCENAQPAAVQPMTCNQGPYGCCSDGLTSAKGPNKEGCPVVQQTTSKPSKCKLEQEKASMGVMDIFIPDCKPNGQYNEVQCYTFPGIGKTQCWCVDPDSGVEQAGTRLNEKQPDCLALTTTKAPVTEPAVPPKLIVCVVTVYRCCPDGVTPAKGPNNKGCPALLTTPPPVPLETSPTVPQGSANEVCVTIRFKQVWYQQLLNHEGSYYVELQKSLENSVKQIYKIHPDFVNVHFKEARPEPNPMHPSGANALAVFFVLSFRRLVADPLATLRDSIDENPNLAERSVFPMTLRNLGKPINLKCPQDNYKPFNPQVKKPTPVTPGTKATSKPVVTTAPFTVNPCGSCTTPETCPPQCPPPQPPTTPTNPPTTPSITTPSTPPVAPATTPQVTQPKPPPITQVLPKETTTPKAPPPVTAQPGCGPCPSPAACPPQCPVTPPQTPAPPPSPQTGAPPTLPPQTTTGPPIPMQTTVPPPLPPQTTTPPCVPWPCHIPPCAPPCQTTTPSPTTVTTPSTVTTPTTVTTPQTSPTTPATNATTLSPPPTTPPMPTTPPPAPTKRPTVNGGYTVWTEWTECSVTCDGGVQQRTRACTNPPPQYGGKQCADPSFETKACNTRPCPVDGGYGSWTPFQQCSSTCGGGQQFRTRQCDSPKAMYGGQNCSRLGPAKETRNCNTFYCPIHGNYSDWTDFMACSVTCGGGIQYKTRTCDNPPPQHGGNNCSAFGPHRISRQCNTQNCPVDGGYSPFSKFSECTATCGGGTQIRTRTCTNPPPRHGGDDCAKDGPDFETRKCNTQLCPVDGAFSPYSEYSACSKTCGGGAQWRMRSCSNPEPQYGGKNCTGTYKESRGCNTQPCPIDGGFSEWGNYSRCEVTCGGGSQMRMRTCTNPPPGNGGLPCQGLTTETRDCNIQPCPVNGGYSIWSNYGPCSASCGGGSQQRTRECTNPSPAQGGRSCSSLGVSHETRKCANDPCPISGDYNSWSEWSSCSKPCGGGVMRRNRNCTNPPPQYNGKDCSTLGPKEEEQHCNLMPCPIHGNYSSWTEWTSCTVTCGGGEHMRSRTCTNPPPEFGGKDCTSHGKSTETESCNVQSCPVDGGYSEWSKWASCSVTCGEGHEYRTRTCSSPSPKFGGSDCSVLGMPTDSRNCVMDPCPVEPTDIPPEEGWSLCSKSCGGGVQWRKLSPKDKVTNETRMCASDPCPVDGGYSQWSDWTQCSQSCGGGVMSRSRTCTEPIPMFGGQRCEDPEGPIQTKPCNMQTCPAPKIPIRSCREFYERCHKRTDGLYTIYVNEKVTASEIKVYCDMTENQGGWTLVVTSASNEGWNSENIKSRNEDEPSLEKDYSILEKANDVKGIALGPFLIRLEAHERSMHGGIWSVPQSYSFTNNFNNQTGITEVVKFPPNWNYGPTTLGMRMPWVPDDDTYALLTTSDRLGKEWFGTLVAKKPLFKPSPWMLDTKMSNPTRIWYWMKEAPSLLSPPSDIEPDAMCPSPVAGGYSEWTEWEPCPKTCGGGTQLRTRKCNAPQPLNGGDECEILGPNVDTRKCNILPCPGQTVNGGYTSWSEWSECTATCGGGSQMRNRKCEEPMPQNGGKSCVEQGLGKDIEVQKCNIQACPSPCSPPCENGGQCVNNHCVCTPGLYEGTSCQTAICKKPCQNGGTCLDPVNNTCECSPNWGGQSCDKPICVRYCRNGGVCTTAHACKCNGPYSGRRCQKSDCAQECVNGGTCSDGECQCRPGYSGNACEIVERCRLPKPEGPCFAVLQDIVNQTTADNFDTPCMTFLREVYQTCSSKGMPEMTKDVCEQQCEHHIGLCSKIWSAETCPRGEDKYYYDAVTSQCKSIRFNGCLGNHNLFATLASCTEGCTGGGNFGPQPTVVTPLATSKNPPIPTSYYWYFLTINGNKQIIGNPPLAVKGTYRLIDLGLLFDSKESWVEGQISNQDGLLDPDKLVAGLSIGLKIKFDESLKLCKEPRYLLDTGATSLQTRGLSIFVVGNSLSVQITTAKHIFKAYTTVTFGRWKYLMITWHPSTGVNIYFDGAKYSSSQEPLSANNPGINVQMPNFAIGRKVGTVGGTCGKFYMSSLAVFKQLVNDAMVKRIYQFFWVNIVSQSQPQINYIRLNVTNRAGQPIIIHSGDDMPSAGFRISANVIAMITKTVPGTTATSFTVYGSDGQQLLLNNQPSIEVNPSPTKQTVISLLVGKPSVARIYHLFMRITNSAKRGIRVLRKAANEQAPKEFAVNTNSIVMVDIKLNSSSPVTISVVDKENKPLFINYKQSMVLTPTEYKGNPIPLIATTSTSPTLNYEIKLSFSNYGSSPVTVKSSDEVPKEGFHIKPKTITTITKKVSSPNSISLTAVDQTSNVAVAINNAASLVVTPWPVFDKERGFVRINITKGIIKVKPVPNVFSLYLVVINQMGRSVRLIPNDNQPAEGFEIPVGTVVIVSKLCKNTKPVDFIAVDPATETMVLVNGTERQSVIPSGDGRSTTLSISAPEGSGEASSVPSVRPMYYWSFFFLNNGTILGSPSFSTSGNVQVANDGIFLDGVSAYLSTHMNADDALVYPDRFAEGGLAFAVKIKLHDSVKEYKVPKYILDSGAKSLSSRGVSLYLLEKKLVVELATSGTLWKTETDISSSTNKWLYILVSWSQERGLTLYVDGANMGGDSGGLAVSGYTAAPQEENLRIGRNLGDDQANLACFYIASLAIFRQALPSELAAQSYRYYIRNAIIQPSKMYYISMRINNTLDKEVELVSNDGHPPGGVLLKPKQTLVLRKEISFSASVMFTAQDVSTGSGLLLNDGEEYVATPSEYKQQLTSIDITDCEFIDKPAPRDRYYATLILKNKYKSTAVIISNDNHPSDGYRIGSGSQETLTKEVLSPGDIVVRAFDPTTGKPLLVNGEESYSVTPSREKRNPDALEITSQDEGDMPTSLSPVPYSHYWSMGFINKGFVEGNPAFKVNGEVAIKDGGINFDGETAWLGATVDRESCLMNPGNCIEGFSLGTKLKFEDIPDNQDDRYIIDTGAQSTARRGVSLFVKGGKLAFVLATAEKTWMASTPVVPNKWFFLLIMWNRNDGLSMYMDNQLKASARDGRPNPEEKLPTTEQTNLNVGRNINGQSAPHNAHFLMSSLVMFNRNIPTQTVPSITSYFSKPIAVHPLTKYYIMLKITNPTQNDIILQPSDKYPAGGFTISKKAIAKVKKEVSSPSAVSFVAQLKGEPNKYILLNGKTRIKVSPSESPLEVFDVNFSPKGETVEGPIQGDEEETGVKAPPVTPTLSWLMAELDAGKVPGNPALAANGKLARIDGGLAFDGNTGSLEGTLGENQCLVNPDLCSEGLSFGVKVKFMTGSLTVNEPRYVVDTGRTAMGRGIAVYVIMSELYVEVATSNALYKGSVKFQADRWFFLIATWSRKTGLSLYMDGHLTATIPDGISGQGYSIYQASPNMVIGRSASAKAYYCEFSMSSFVTFNKLLSPGNVIAVTNFFWIRGSEGKGRTFYVVLKVVNPLPATAVLLPDDGLPNEGIRIPPNGMATIVKTVKSGGSISFSATDRAGNSVYFLNNRDMIKVHASRSKDVVTRAVLSTTGVSTESFGDVQIYRAPPVFTRYAWTMNTISIEAKKVPGTPPLAAYGQFTKGDGGLIFDGKTNFLGGHLQQPSCAIDPDQCVSGFTLATKLFLDESIESYIEQKYIIDTGATSSNARGFSMYVMGGKLYFELVSASKLWFVSEQVMLGTWSFIAVTWSQANGLQMYVDGAKAAFDVTGRSVSGRNVIQAEENIVVGREVSASGTRYCKFIMASLLMADSYLSPSMMRALYSFYWRQTPSTSVGFVALQLKNQAGVDALIMTSDNQPQQGLSIPHLYPVILEKQIAPGSHVSLAAKEAVAKTPLLLNNHQSVSVSGDLKGYQIIVTKPKIVMGEKFYFTIKILNRNPQDIVIKSSDNDPKEGYPVKKATAKTITKSVSTNLPITFTAVDGTGKAVQLNGTSQITITPTEKKGAKVEVVNCGPAGQGGEQRYISIKIINRVGKAVNLNLPLPGQKPLAVKKNVMMVVTKGTTSSETIKVTGTDETNKPIAINGATSVELTPTKAKQQITLELKAITVKGKKKGDIPEHKATVFYVTLRVKNKAGSSVLVAPTLQDGAHGFHIGTTTAMQITKEYFSQESIKLQAFDPNTGKPLLMNGKQLLLVRPGLFSDPAVRVEITKPVGEIKPPVAEHFITLLVNNKMSREVRLIPSKGKKGGYVVSPKSFLKVHIIIKGGPADPKPISFKAQDVETESTLEINEKMTPMSVSPAEMSDIVTKFNITAPAPSVKPQHSWSMAALKGTHIFGSPSLHAHGFYRYVDDGISFDGADTFMNAVLPQHDVLVNPGSNAEKGFTIATKIRFGSQAVEYDDEPRIILDTGGHQSGKPGVSLYIDRGDLYAEVQTSDRLWKVSRPVTPKVWLYLTLTWNAKDGLKMYKDSVLRSDDDTGRPVTNTTSLDVQENLTLGRNIGKTGNILFTAFDMSSLTTFGESLNQPDIDKAFIFFSSGASAKIFYAPIRISNEAGRNIVIKPSKGNDRGFHMIPRSTLEVTLMSMSTDGLTPSPVTFTAFDSITKLPLEINNSPEAFPVVPRESMQDFTTMVVAVPEPSVTPAFAWSIQKVRDGQILGASPTIQAFGDLKETDEGVQLDGKESWLDAGDFKGKCLSDPQLCPAGFTVGLKVKFDDESSKYMDEPHYVIDTGGASSNGRGFSMYLKNRMLYATVTQSNSAWRVESPYVLNKWYYALVTWKPDSGLSLYMDGSPVASSEAVVSQQGQHLDDSVTHLALGRNAAGPPYGNTKMSVASLVFFEHHVRSLDAQKISMYYWSSVAQSSSDRFIKVRFDNRAGIPVTIIPSKGDNKKQGYTIQPHMNLQLSYVEKGPFNNIPVTFLAQKASNGERLYINGRMGSLRVMPSASKSAIIEGIVASSYSCPYPNGFFPDPTSNTRYIHCTDKNPTVMFCPDQMTWHSDIKSCAGEGRESGNLYYYNVRFNNFAGSPAEIIKTTGHKQRNLLPPGKALHVKFTSNKKHPSIFRAIYANTGDTLRLNDYPLLQVYPSDNPSTVTDVTVSKPAFFYTIETKTGKQENADTQANVFIKLIGEDGITQEMPLAHKGVTHFKLGGLDKFRIEASDIGKLKKVYVRHDNSGQSPNWYLKTINIRDKNNRAYQFQVDSWLDSEQGDHVTAKLLDTADPMFSNDQCTPSCINNGTCFDGKCQCPAGYEGRHCQHAVCDIPCLNGGTCISPGSNKCACPDGYNGKYCDKPMCADYCRNGGTCSGPDQCTCPKGYMGPRCETSKCSPDCMNGGRCVDGACQCPEGHSGKFCEQVSICDLPSEPGPCFHEIFKAASRAQKHNRTSSCIRYLDDILKSCTANNGSFTMDQCSKICEREGEESICKKIWQPGQCSSLLTKYTYDKDSGSCQPMLYNGCLGNRNSFDSIHECTTACIVDRRKRSVRNTTQEQKPKHLKDLLHKSFHHIRRHVSYK